MSSIKEKKIKDNTNYISVDKLKEYSEILEKCVCKIISGKGGSGFFCKLNINEFSDIQRPFLMTNNHVLDQNFINSESNLIIKIKNKEKILNLNNRIKLTDPEKDFTIIEIKSYDKIYDFLEVCPNIMQENYRENLVKTEIAIPQFPENKLSVSFGVIMSQNKNDIYYNASTDSGSSGSPILLLNNLQIIGIHKQRQTTVNLNGGTFIKDILESIREMKNLNNINMLEEQKELNISNLELINIIKNDDEPFREIIILKDGRLCSMDERSNIKIYNKKSYKADIEINYSTLPDTYIKINNWERNFINYYKLGCTNNNELFFYAKNCIFIVLINQKEYNIIQQLPFEHFHGPNLYLFENDIILSDYNNLKKYQKNENQYDLIDEFKSPNVAESSGTYHKEKFEFEGSTFEINNWTIREWIEISEIQNEKIEKNELIRFPGTFHKNQKVFIKPYYLILGNSELLIQLKNGIKEIDESVIQKKAFGDKEASRYDNFNGKTRINYENLSSSSFIYLSEKTFLSQINIIENEQSFDLQIAAQREDIKGNFFIRNGDILFILSKDRINVYHF